MGKQPAKQVKIVEQVPFEEIEEVSFEEFDRTMSKIVQSKPPQKKPPKEERNKVDDHSRPSTTP